MSPREGGIRHVSERRANSACCGTAAERLCRTEIRSRAGDSHLGRVFTGAPGSPNGVRYCISSAALRFVSYEKVEAEAYGCLLSLPEKCFQGHTHQAKKQAGCSFKEQPAFSGEIANGARGYGHTPVCILHTLQEIPPCPTYMDLIEPRTEPGHNGDTPAQEITQERPSAFAKKFVRELFTHISPMRGGTTLGRKWI